jgi:hypothetical protein
MASIVLERTWLADANDPADSVALFTTGRTDMREQGGEVRTYANGRQRLVTTAGRRQTLAVTFRLVDAATLAKLDSWAGRVLLLRDPWGRKMYGTYLGLSVTDYAARAGHDVQLTFQQVSFSEAV